MAAVVDLSGFFVRYADAFSGFDLDRICAFLDDLLVIVTEEKTHTFHDRPTIRTNMEGLLRTYRRLGVARSVPVSVVGQPLVGNPLLAAADIVWCLQDLHGRQLLRFSTGYLLRRRGNDWRIAVAIAHDEGPKLARAVSQANGQAD